MTYLKHDQLFCFKKPARVVKRSVLYQKSRIGLSTLAIIFVSYCYVIGFLISNPTRTLVCAANHLYFLCNLGNLSAASLLARDSGACAAWPGLVAEKGEPPRTPSIYATDTWSGRVGKAKYKRRDANDNKSGCKVQNAKCEMRGAKCEARSAKWE